MQLSELERHVFAYFLAKAADEFRMDPRFWPPIELSSIIEDKIRFPVSRFGVADRATIDNVAKAFLSVLIAREGFVTKEGEYGPMYQFNSPNYRACIAELRDANPIIAQAKASDDDDFWDNTFEKLKS